jgi:hypothetical protein
MGLPPLGTTFSHGGKTYAIAGLKKRATKRPIICSSGSGSYVFPTELVKRLCGV